MLYYSFTVNSMIRGYHIYQEIWEPINGEELGCEREVSNPKDPLAVAVIKPIAGENTIIGHVPRNISSLCSLFIRRGGGIKCFVDGSRRYSADLPQGGMEIPCKLIFSTKSADDCEKLKKLVSASLSDKTTECEIVGPMSTEQVMEVKATETIASKAIKWTEGHSNVLQNQSDGPLVSETTCTKPDGAILIAEGMSCSPPKKRQRVYNEERIIMGDELTDLEINFAQQLLKQQCDHINGLSSTLLQEKESKLTRDLVKNRVQIIYCRNRKHWVAASTINSEYNTVKVYDSLFRYLDPDSLQTIENVFQFDDIIPEVKMMQCRKQQGGKDCGIYAIAFIVALAMGVNPSRQNFNQDMMRPHLVNCFKKERFSLFPCK